MPGRRRARTLLSYAQMSQARRDSYRHDLRHFVASLFLMPVFGFLMWFTYSRYSRAQPSAWPA